MNKFNRFMLMFAPDEGGAGPAVIETISAPGVDVPVLESPVGGDITPVEIANEETDGGVKSPSDLFGEDGQDLMDEADAKMGKKIERERDENGKFLPKKEKEVDKTKPAAVAKPVEKPAEVSKPVETPVAKVKIDDKEMTPEEIADELKELRAKAAAKPAEQAPDPKAEQERAAEAEKALTERRQTFLTSAAERYTPTEQEWDKALVGGPEAAKTIGTMLAKAEMGGREAAANMVNEAMETLEKRLAPILEREKTIAQYQEENTAINAFPEIKANPKGIEIYRQVKTSFDEARNTISSKGESATPQEKAWLAAYNAQTPEGLREAIANHAKAEIAKLPVAASPNAKPAVIQQVTKPIRPTKPFSGDRPGGISSPKSESSQARFVRDMDMGG